MTLANVEPDTWVTLMEDVEDLQAGSEVKVIGPGAVLLDGIQVMSWDWQCFDLPEATRVEMK